MRRSPQTNRVPPVAILAFVLVFACHATLSHATFFENIAVDARAVSLANSVTAYPPGIMSVHYNPAGLSTLHDGRQINIGFTTAAFTLESSFSADPDFNGWLGGYYDNADDPVNGKSGSTAGVHMYVPLLGSQDTDAIGLDTPLGFTSYFAPFPLGISYRKPKSRWTFAIAAYAPSLGGYYRDENDPARYLGRAVSMQDIVYAAPAVSYQLTDTLSIGMTVGLGQAATSIDMDMRMPNDLIAMTKLLGDVTQGLEIPILSELTLPPPWFGGGIGPYEDIANLKLDVRDDYCPRYNFGLLWEPCNWFSLGLSYQSKVETEQQGKYKITYSESFQRMVAWMGSSPLLLAVSLLLDLPYQSTPYQTGTIMLKGVDTPQMAHAGIVLRPFKRLRLMCDAHWADYSQVKQYTLLFDRDIQAFQIAKFVGHTEGDYTFSMTQEMESEIHMSYGLEIQILDWLYWRCGYEQRKTSVNPLYFNVMSPIPDLDSYGTGLSFHLKDGLVIDLAYGYLKSDDWYVPDNYSKNMNSTLFTDAVYNPYAGLDVSGKMDVSVIMVNLSMPFKYVYKIGNIAREVYNDIRKKINF